jgi:hypothetical protein
LTVLLYLLFNESVNSILFDKLELTIDELHSRRSYQVGSAS